jgi:hypothetical protein
LKTKAGETGPEGKSNVKIVISFTADRCFKAPVAGEKLLRDERHTSTKKMSASVSQKKKFPGQQNCIAKFPRCQVSRK